MQKIIDAEKSDLFDVLAHVAYALPPLTREERAAQAKVVISTHFNTKQQVFLDFVLSHYVRVGVEELDQEKLTPLLRLKYHDSIADAVADLGRPEDIGTRLRRLPEVPVPATGDSLGCRRFNERRVDHVKESDVALCKRRDELRRLGIDLRQHVGVDVQGEGHGGMPEAPRDDRRIDALGQGEAGVGVAQPV